jgi:hypothetical protein
VAVKEVEVGPSYPTKSSETPSIIKAIPSLSFCIPEIRTL